MSIIDWLALGILVLAYGVGSVVELIKWQEMSEQYMKWGYPRYWAIVTPVIKIAAAIMLIFMTTRVFGAVICAAVAIAGSVTVLWYKDKDVYMKAFPMTLVTIGCAAVLII
jgi:uncharacterized membrane protein YphA (DoxX/SURF4 family)